MWSRLIGVMNEIDEAIVRTSFSTIVGESRDFAYILTDELGGLCARAASARRTSRGFSARQASSSAFRWKPCRKGTSSPNDTLDRNRTSTRLRLISPVVARTRSSHLSDQRHSDVGGHVGDIEAMDVFQEGVRLPPCKLYVLGTKRGRLRILRQLPRSNLVLGDLRAMIEPTVSAQHGWRVPDDSGWLTFGCWPCRFTDAPRRRCASRFPPLPTGSTNSPRDRRIRRDRPSAREHPCEREQIHVTTAAVLRRRPARRSTAIQHPPSPRPCTHSNAPSCPRCPTTRGCSTIHVAAPLGSILDTTFPNRQTPAKTTNNRIR